jgi:hypothetical protein
MVSCPPAVSFNPLEQDFFSIWPPQFALVDANEFSFEFLLPFWKKQDIIAARLTDHSVRVCRGFTPKRGRSPKRYAHCCGGIVK